MATIHNSELLRELRQAVSLQQGKDPTPVKLADTIVPVVEVNPRYARIVTFAKNGNATNATATTIFTSDANVDTFITAVTLGVIKDVTSTSTVSAIEVYINGAAVNLIRIPGITLTVQSEMTTLSLNPPVKIDKNTTVRVTNATNVANIRAEACVMGFTVDNSNS